MRENGKVRRLLRPVLYVLCMLITSGLGYRASAQSVDIKISKAGANKKIGIAVSAQGSSAKAAAIRAVLLDDLNRSGWFVPVAAQSASYSLSLNVSGRGNTLSAVAQLTRDSGATRVMTQTFTGSEAKLRWMAHEISDAVVLAVMKRPGIATARILMVGKRSGRKDLFFCDYDGQGLQQITRDGVPCHSPSWGSSPNSVYYTSAHAGFPDIYNIEIPTRKRTRVAKFPGLNAGAALSPDARSIAMILSKDGNPELYIQDLASGRLSRMTRTRHASEASPSWSPDGRSLVFVSDTTGAPQVYTITRSGGKAKRLPVKGSENVSPDWGPDGTIVMSSRRNRRYQLVQYDPATGQEVQLTMNRADHEEPSWGRDGRHIVYARVVGYRESLYILDTLGDPEVALTKFPGDWYSPAWARFP